MRARNSVNRLIGAEVLFTYTDPQFEGALPAMNNQIEGATNAPLRQLLRDHRGMRLTRRIKAIFWWCYMHTECPLPAAEIARSMPTDADIDLRYEPHSRDPKGHTGPHGATGPCGRNSTTRRRPLIT